MRRERHTHTQNTGAVLSPLSPILSFSYVTLFTPLFFSGGGVGVVVVIPTSPSLEKHLSLPSPIKQCKRLRRHLTKPLLETFWLGGKAARSTSTMSTYTRTGASMSLGTGSTTRTFGPAYRSRLDRAGTQKPKLHLNHWCPKPATNVTNT